jgi:hypothetical protein
VTVISSGKWSSMTLRYISLKSFIFSTSPAEDDGPGFEEHTYHGQIEKMMNENEEWNPHSSLIIHHSSLD